MIMKLSNKIGIVAGVAAALLFSGPVWAQERAVDVFVQIFNIDGADETLEGDRDGAGVGSVGCGATGRAGGDFEGAEALANALGVSLAEVQELDIFGFCDGLTATNNANWSGDATSDAGVFKQLEDLAPDQLFSQSDGAATLAGLQVSNVSARIKAVRLARRGLSELDAYAFERGNDTPSPYEGAFGSGEQQPLDGRQFFAHALQRGFSAGDGLLGVDGLSAFINGQYTRIDADNSSFETGSDANGGGVTLGIDKQLGKNAFLGLAFGYSALHTKFKGGAGDSDLDDYTFSLYGSIFPTENLYVDGIVSGSILRFDQTHKIAASSGSPFSVSKSKPDGWYVTGDLGIGGEIQMKPVDLNPYARVALSRTRVDSFTESGGTLALHIDKQKNTSLTTTIGMSVSLPISTGFGVVSPYARGEYVHEYKDQADDVRGNLVVIPEATFQLEPNKTDRNYARVGGGVALALAGGFSAFADYDVVLGFSDLLVQQATLGGRLEF